MEEMVVTVIAATFSAGASLTTGALVLMLLRMVGLQSLRVRLPPLGGGSRAYGDISDTLQKWMIRAGNEYSRKLFRVGKVPYLLFLCLLALVGFWVGFAFLKNLLAAVLLAFICVVLCEQVRAGRKRAYREKVVEQLGAAVRVFSTEYADTPHPVKALATASNKLPDPIGAILRRTARDLSSSRNYDEIDRALLHMDRKLSNEYGRLFVQLLRLSFEDQAVKPLFARLAARVTTQQDLIRKNRLEVSLDRKLAVFLNLAVIPAYFFVSKVVPEAKEFFTTTAAGKGLVALCLFSMAVGSLLDILMGGGEQVE